MGLDGKIAIRHRWNVIDVNFSTKIVRPAKDELWKCRSPGGKIP